MKGIKTIRKIIKMMKHQKKKKIRQTKIEVDIIEKKFNNYKRIL